METKLNKKCEKSPCKILHVEDVDFNFGLISMYLEDKNVEIKIAENGKQALEVLKTYRPDLILMDIEMPIMNGYEATKIIKKDEKLKSIPVIAITTYASDEDIQKFGYIFDDYLTKPITQEVFLKCVVKYLK